MGLMQPTALTKRRERALKRRIEAIRRVYPELIDRINESGYRQEPLHLSRQNEIASAVVHVLIDPKEQSINMKNSDNMEEALYACLLLSFTFRTVAIEHLAIGLESGKSHVRHASARVLFDLFVLGNSREESWGAISALLKANERYIPEAIAELKGMLGDQSQRQISEKGNIFAKLRNALNPIAGLLTGGAGFLLMNFGLVGTGAAVIGLGLAAGSFQKIIEKRSKKKIDYNLLLRRATEVLGAQPEAI